MFVNNLVSLQLLCSRQKALQHPQLASNYSNTSILKNSVTHILCCPFLVVHDETAEKLNARKLSLATNLSEVLQHQCFQSVITTQILEFSASFYSSCQCEYPQRRLRWYYNGNRLVLIRCNVDANISHE
jgi:hypothetical protein